MWAWFSTTNPNRHTFSLLHFGCTSHYSEYHGSDVDLCPHFCLSPSSFGANFGGLCGAHRILEKVVAEQLTVHLENHEIFDKFQSGFSKRHSTETTLLKVSSDILVSADSGEYTVLVLLDLSSAFDTVDHNILIKRLHDLVGMYGSVLQWFSSYLSGRTFSVCVNQIMSDTTELSCGVPQGSVLGPILFLLYILPLGTIIRSYNNVSYHFHADDIQLYCKFKPSELHKLSSLTDCLANIKKWLNDNFLKLNSDKTETLIIAPDDKIPQIRQYIGDVLGSSVQSSLRNLGVKSNQIKSNQIKSILSI